MSELRNLNLLVTLLRGRNLPDLLDTLEPIRVGFELVSQTGGIVGKLSCDEPNPRGELSSEERGKTGSQLPSPSTYLLPVKPRHWLEQRTGTKKVMLRLHCQHQQSQEEREGGEGELHTVGPATAESGQ